MVKECLDLWRCLRKCYPYVCTGYGGFKSGAGNCSETFVAFSPEDADVGAVGR